MNLFLSFLETIAKRKTQIFIQFSIVHKNKSHSTPHFLRKIKTFPGIELLTKICHLEQVTIHPAIKAGVPLNHFPSAYSTWLVLEDHFLQWQDSHVQWLSETTVVDSISGVQTLLPYAGHFPFLSLSFLIWNMGYMIYSFWLVPTPNGTRRAVIYFCLYN